MNNLKIIFGDVTEDLSLYAKQIDPNAFLVSASNYNSIKCPFADPTTIYTSLGDLRGDMSIVYNLLDKADQIYFFNKDVWSDNKKIDYNNVTGSIQGLTETILFYFQQQKNNVQGLDLSHYQTEKYTKLADVRKTENKQLWIAGCSISHGAGVGVEQRFGTLIAKKLNLPVSFLTEGGSSIEWAVDQILRSDLRKDDIVILGLTNERRFSLWSLVNSVLHITSNHNQHGSIPVALPKKAIDLLLTDETRIYNSIRHIEQLINFCNKIEAKLLIVGLLSTDNFNIHLHKHQEFIAYKNFNNLSIIDSGTDNQHPGPKQHELYADFCLTHLKKSTTSGLS